MTRKALLATMALVGCGAADVPETYYGRVGAIELAIPSRVATSVLYKGESDWTPPEQPRSQRTSRDTIAEVEFFADLDHPAVLQEDTYENRVRLSRDGPLFGVSVLLGEEWRETAEHIRARYMKQDQNYRTMRRGPDVYGLQARHQDYSTPVPGRERYGLERIDADYLSVPDDTYIQCNDARVVVAPYNSVASCHIFVIDQVIGARLMTDFGRDYLPRWRDLRAAMLGTLASFRVR